MKQLLITQIALSSVFICCVLLATGSGVVDPQRDEGYLWAIFICLGAIFFGFIGIINL